MIFSWLLVLFLFAGNKTPVKFNDFDPLNFSEVPQRKWREPLYAKQKKGTNKAFAIPEGMRQRVQFWVDIYSKYSSDQGVLHDADNINIIYEVIDFRDIEARTDISDRTKLRLREKRVKTRKLAVKNRLLSLRGVKSKKGLKGERLKTFLDFANVEESRKFLRASHRSRLRFQLGQRDRFQQAIYYSGRYLEKIEQIFTKHGLPLQLTRLVYVESSFNVYAVSKVGASGLFQIMPRTGRQYFRVGRSVDYRNHPYKAADAAARLLKQYYKMLDSWPLAVTGYNHGAYGVKKLTRRHRTRSLNELISMKRAGRRFGFASQNFYATFLAALEVETNAKKYFGKVIWSPPLKMEDFVNSGMLSWETLVEVFQGDAAMARLYNPHLTYRVRKGYRLIPSKTLLHIPVGQKKRLAKLISIRVPKAKYRRHWVRSGETLSRIAKKFGTTVSAIKRANNIKSVHKIRKGQLLLIP